MSDTKTVEVITLDDVQEVNEQAATWEDITIPTFPRSFFKPQAAAMAEGSKWVEKGGREFTASGPKADRVVKMVLFGHYNPDGMFTREEMRVIADCSVSRVGEVIWTMEAGGMPVDGVLKRRPTVKQATEAEAIEAETTDIVEQLIEAADAS
jgi:hypothetical protein